MPILGAAVVHALWSADAAEALPGVGEAAIQVFGGIGFTWEMDIHLFDKRLCSQALLGGGAARHLEALAMQILD